MDDMTSGLSAEILAECSGFLQQQGPEPGSTTPSNTGDPTLLLSPEMLAECFVFLDLRDLISASHVSRTWRSSALAFPALWSDIPITWPLYDPEAIINMAISRAGQRALDFEYHPFSSHIPGSLVAAVGKQMHRFRTFIWEYDFGSLDFTLPAPLLQKLVCGMHLISLPRDFLGGSVGNLHTLRLGDVRFPRECPALATLTHLLASYPWYLDGDMGFDRIFALCPQLEVLHLRNIQPREVSLPTGPAPRTLRLVKLHADADCDLVQVHKTWGVASPQVRLKMPLTTAYSMSSFLEGALDIAAAFEPHNKARIVANLPDSRRHTLVFYELEEVFQPAVVIAKIFNGMTSATAAQVRSLRLPLSVLGPVLASTARWSRISRLTVDMYEHDAYDTQPYEFGETYRRFRWTTLGCLRLMPQRFPRLSALALALHRKDPKKLPLLDDARELVQYLSVPGNCPLSEVLVHAFPADVVPSLSAENMSHPRIVFDV
ncbi:hypothetical protein AURDEDRAFT_187918 [Auricularia subglabra TFB-10046 SS5]|uniref:F-box domain-containing protein n=1 Tax=Auricularia subglabra (strain TFB-10046 / SS5) TaxID=717982 RepID=J0D0R6_AURST|nr:hypothetical protein AURDEDRAFT_187918 [Auricularia subglabra TFB-10046 SS5]